MNKAECQRELEDVSTLYVVGIKRSKTTLKDGDRGQWRKFKVYYLKDGELALLTVDSGVVAPNWNPLHETRSGNLIGRYFESKIQGINRPEHIVKYIGQWLYEDPNRFVCGWLSEHNAS